MAPTTRFQQSDTSARNSVTEGNYISDVNVFNGEAKNYDAWGTRKQKLVTTSTTAAEIVAIEDSLPEMMLLKLLDSEIMGLNRKLVIFEDNQSSIRILEGGDQRKLMPIIIKSKAIEEAKVRGELVFEYLPGKKQLADGFTKALGKTKFREMVEEILN